MIRRDAGDDWLLISQVEHARIAAEMAEAWLDGQCLPLPSRDLLMHAIRHHDDGWAEWERSPTINPGTGAPRDFLEMPIAEAAVIWTRSIDHCVYRSPLCGLWVSRHFCHLAGRAYQFREAAADRQAASDFLESQAGVQSRCRMQLAADRSPNDTAADEEAGLEWLRCFDQFSLWLCCAERSTPDVLNVPDVGPIQLLPRDSSTIGLEPFPFRGAALRLTMTGLRLRCRSLASDGELRAELRAAPRCELSWVLQRAS